MAKFLELHRSNENTPLVINVDWVIWIEQRKNYTCIALGFGEISEQNGKISTSYQYLSVKETYLEIKELLNL